MEMLDLDAKSYLNHIPDLDSREARENSHATLVGDIRALLQPSVGERLERFTSMRQGQQYIKRHIHQNTRPPKGLPTQQALETETVWREMACELMNVPVVS